MNVMDIDIIEISNRYVLLGKSSRIVALLISPIVVLISFATCRNASLYETIFRPYVISTVIAEVNLGNDRYCKQS